MIRRVLVSVSNKSGIEEFCRQLQAQGVEIVSTGGTAKRLADSGIVVRTIDDLTGFPEMMDGRVKTLHPKVHGGILALRDKAEHMAAVREHDIELIDLVVVNLYPFEATVSKDHVTQAEAVENIDIGGPAMVRSAAKNYHHVGVVVDPNDYVKVLEEIKVGKELSLETRYYLMQKAFAHTSAYDAMIARYMNRTNVFTNELTFSYRKVADLRYGENPHQAAAYYGESLTRCASITQAEIIQGKQLSYNNIMDADAALRVVLEFDQPAATVIKHTNPCGTAIGEDITTAFTRAYEADSLSAFGGIVALNRTCTTDIAEYLSKVFVEVVLAPDFTDEAVAVFAKKAKVRLLRLGKLQRSDLVWETRKILGGTLVQESNTYRLQASDLKVVTDAQPTAEQMTDLQFAWTVCKYVKSNAIVLVKDGVTRGIGAGQMSRIDSVKMAIWKAQGQDKNTSATQGLVLASDAFFPFRDSIDVIAKEGIAAIIQPGGSIKDGAVIDAANEHKLPMVFTGYRAFLH
jgi:phosphoribosylaminoimidazolecarboxamide formyltransferase/IMP cyclohydrolase